MGSYIIDDGENTYAIDYNIPNVKKKILRRHKRVMAHIKRTWYEIKNIMKFYINHGIGTNELMERYVKLFLNQSRIKI